MAWYRTGTIAVTNGSATVTGTGTAFVANIRAGYGFSAPDGKVYEVLAVISDTQLTLAANYGGTTASGASYAIFPTQSVISDLVTQVNSLLGSFVTVRDGVGAGLNPDGVVGTPAIRFTNDQDTGIYRFSSDTLGIAAGGQSMFLVNTFGVVLNGTTASIPNGINFAGGNVGIGATPTSLLSLSAASPTLTIKGTTTTATTIGAKNIRVLFMGDSGTVGNGAEIVWAASSDTNTERWAAISSSVLTNNGSGATGNLIFATKAAATDTALAERLVIDSAGVVRPGADNSQTNGAASFRWSTIYAGTGTINTSDEREKTWRGGLSEAEYEAGLLVLDELGFYQWDQSIEANGPASARYHFGIRAQRVWTIFSDAGLVDPLVDNMPGATPYAFLCFDAWDASLDGPAGNRFGIRPTDLTLFLLAVQARRSAELEARIAALETPAP